MKMARNGGSLSLLNTLRSFREPYKFMPRERESSEYRMQQIYYVWQERKEAPSGHYVDTLNGAWPVSG